MSKRNEIRENARRADELVKQLSAEGNLLPPNGVKTTVFTNRVPDIMAQTDAQPTSETTLETEESPVTDGEIPSANEKSATEDDLDGELVSKKQYKSAVKAMNEAQRQKAEYERLSMDREQEHLRIKAELEAFKRQNLAPKEDTTDTELDQTLSEWNDLPDTQSMVKQGAKVVINRVNEKVSAVEQEIFDLKKTLEDSKIQVLVAERDKKIKEVHSDYDDVRLSDEFKAWIYSDAPSMYKKVYEGAVSFDEKDAISIVDSFKSFVSPKSTKKNPASKVGSAEVSVKTSPAVASDMGSSKEDDFSSDDLASLPYVINKLRDPKQRKALMDRADKFISKQMGQ